MMNCKNQEIKNSFSFSMILTERKYVYLFLILLFSCNLFSETSTLNEKNILVIHGIGITGEWEQKFSEHLYSTFKGIEDLKVNIIFEYIGADDLNDHQLKNLLDYLKTINERQSLDLIIGVLPVANRFIQSYNEILFKGIDKILVIPDSNSVETIKDDPEFSVIYSASPQAIKNTIKRIHSLIPDIEKLVVVSGNGIGDKYYKSLAYNALKDLGYLDHTEFLIGLTTDEIIYELSHLSPHSAVLLLSYDIDKNNKSHTTQGLLSIIHEITNAPIFGFYDTLFGHGLTGGNLTSVELYAEEVVVMSLQKLSYSGSGIIPSNREITKDIYDWRELHKWDIPHRLLPENSEIMFKPDTLWGKYRNQVIIGILVILTPASFLIFFLIYFNYKKKVEIEMLKKESIIYNRQSEIKSILDSISDALIYVDKSRKIKMINPAFTKIFGYTLPEVLGKTTQFLYANPDSYLEQGKIRYNENQLNDSITKVYEDEYQRKDGSIFYGETLGEKVLDSNKNIIGFIGIVRDITLNKESEKANTKLQEQIDQQSKLEAIGLLAGGVAHDFNNMLSVILGHAGMLLDETNPHQPIHDSLEEIKKAGERSANLTRQLLAFARKQIISPKVLDLNLAVEGMLNMLRRLIGENINLIWQPGKDGMMVNIDPSQIDQMLANLCVNARDAIKDIGKVTIETDIATFDEAYCSAHMGSVPGEYVMLSVSDDGHGMDKETQANIFEPFYTTKELGEGTGLGLSTIYGIVKQNDGFINVLSAHNLGATFQVYLPPVYG
jgi:PAS domain S-box-containing protein